MSTDADKKALFDAMVAYKVDGIKAAVTAASANGMKATEIIDALAEGMTEVGVKFEKGKLFLPHVLSAAAGMNAAMDMLDEELRAGGDATATSKGKAVMGTVEGDVHDIGKSICSTMLQCNGFELVDLGRDVPKQKFIDEVKGGCNFCGMSALMTTTMTVMKEIIDIMSAEGIRDKCTVMVGGAPITQAYADKIGADIYGESASETTRKAKAVASD